jgi:hypothetical protein
MAPWIIFIPSWTIKFRIWAGHLTWRSNPVGLGWRQRRLHWAHHASCSMASPGPSIRSARSSPPPRWPSHGAPSHRPLPSSCLSWTSPTTNPKLYPRSRSIVGLRSSNRGTGRLGERLLACSREAVHRLWSELEGATPSISCSWTASSSSEVRHSSSSSVVLGLHSFFIKKESYMYQIYTYI